MHKKRFSIRNPEGMSKRPFMLGKQLKELLELGEVELHEDGTVSFLAKEFRLHSHLHKASLKPKKPHAIKYDQDITLNYAHIISGGQSESQRRTH